MGSQGVDAADLTDARITLARHHERLDGLDRWRAEIDRNWREIGERFDEADDKRDAMAEALGKHDTKIDVLSTKVDAIKATADSTRAAVEGIGTTVARTVLRMLVWFVPGSFIVLGFVSLLLLIAMGRGPGAVADIASRTADKVVDATAVWTDPAAPSEDPE